jgi:hypothetical protein
MTPALVAARLRFDFHRKGAQCQSPNIQARLRNAKTSAARWEQSKPIVLNALLMSAM